MNRYSRSSATRLNTCHSDLQLIFRTVLLHFDHSILCGYRGEAEQNNAYYAEPQLSKLKFPESKHNSMPSMAVDAGPWDKYVKNVDYSDIFRAHYFAGFVMATARMLFDQKRISHLVRWGGDWDMDTDLKDEKFRDYVHFELYKP